MRLSKNFSLSEFTESETASVRGISNRPTAKQIENLRWMCQNVLQPIRDHYRTPLKISSGFRNAELNRAVGGVEDSYHRCLGYNAAADFSIPGVPIRKLFQYISSANLPYTKLILEFDRWIHIAIERPKRAALVAEKVNGKTRYRVYRTVLTIEEPMSYWEKIKQFWRELKEAWDCLFKQC